MKNFLKTILALGLFFVIAAIALTVVRSASRRPSLILTDKVCEPPCWNGIQPGDMNSAQVLGILNDMYGVNKDSIIPQYDREDNLVRLFWYFQRPVEDGTGTVHFTDDKVTAITILTQNSLTLAGLFGKLGEPDEYWQEPAQGENRRYLDIVLLYPSKGYAANVVVDIADDPQKMQITEDTPVLRVNYFDPALFEQLMETRILVDTAPIARKGTRLPWTGFGQITYTSD